MLDTFVVAAELGTESLGAYVISMCTTPSDILLVELLQREMGSKSPLRVVPLFETVADLQRAPSTLRQLFSIPWYKNHIRGEQVLPSTFSFGLLLPKDFTTGSHAWILG